MNHSYAVIDTLKKESGGEKAAVIYWYFEYGYDHHPDMVRTSFLRQLVENLTALPVAIKELWEHNKGTKYRPDEAALMRAIGDLLGEWKRVFVVMDALDECSHSYLTDILKTIDELQVMGARIFITSRQTEHPRGQSSKWVPIEIKAHHDDLRHLVDHRVQHNCSKVTVPDELREKIVQTLVSKTHGMYVLLATH